MIDTHTEQLALIAFAGEVATLIRAESGRGPRRTPHEQAVHSMADAIHNLEGLAHSLGTGNYATAAFLADMMAGNWTDERNPAAGELRRSRALPRALAALLSISAKAKACVQ